MLALLVAASRRIWFIEVDGCDTVQEADVLAALDEMEVRVGARRTAVHTSPSTRSGERNAMCQSIFP